MSKFRSKSGAAMLMLTMGAMPSACAAGNAEAPYSGSYSTESGEEYLVSTNGPTALSIKGPDELCLLFWRSKDPQLIDGVETLRGQTCSNGKFGDYDWSVSVAERRREVLVLVPPPVTSEDGAIKLRDPIELKFTSAEQ